MKETTPQITFTNVYRSGDTSWQTSAMQMWKVNAEGLENEEIAKRLREVVFITRNAQGQVVGISTAYKAFIKNLGHHLYAFRCLLDQKHRIPGLTSTLLVKTRDYLEEIHATDGPQSERCIGVITLVENERIEKYRTEAVWPASKMIYAGNSKNGHPIRIYYFNDAEI